MFHLADLSMSIICLANFSWIYADVAPAHCKQCSTYHLSSISHYNYFEFLISVSSEKTCRIYVSFAPHIYVLQVLSFSFIFSRGSDCFSAAQPPALSTYLSDFILIFWCESWGRHWGTNPRNWCRNHKAADWLVSNVHLRATILHV